MILCVNPVVTGKLARRLTEPFTDVVIPGRLNGAQIADQGAALRPGLRVLFASGSGRGALAPGAAAYPRAHGCCTSPSARRMRRRPSARRWPARRSPGWP